MQKLRNLIATLRGVQEKTITSKEFMSIKEGLVIVWNSCDTLPIRIFYEILKTKNQKLLLKREQQKLELNENQVNQLNNTWIDLLDSYWQLSNPAKYSTNLRKTKSLITKQNEYTTLVAILMKHSLGVNIAKDLRHWRIKNINQCLHKSRVLKTKIGLDLARLNSDDDKESAYNFYRDLAILEQILNRQIDQESTTVSYWLELNKLANQINKSNGRNK